MKFINFEKIYYRLPVFLQNISASLKGLQLKKLRTKGVYKSVKKQILERRSWCYEKYEKFQIRKLNELLNYADSYVVHYRTLFQGEVPRIKDLSDLSKLPILTKSEILKNIEKFQEKGLHSKKYTYVHTTGTTGSPLKILCTQESRQKNYAFFDEYLESIGIDVTKKHIVIGGRVIVPYESNKGPYWRHSFFQNALLMSSYHLSERSAQEYLNKIKKYCPEYIESYPSSIHFLAQYALLTGQKLNCKAVVTSAECLSDEQRNDIEAAFSCRVYDQYGSAEMSVFAAQCEKGAYHIRPDYGVVEIVDDVGNPVPEGDYGRVIATGFINKSFPLIRYDIGDVAAIGAACSCNLKTPVLKSIQGRKDDIVQTPDGRKVGRLSPVLKGFPIIESQYVQEDKDLIDVYIVPSKDFTEESVGKIKDAVRKRVGQGMMINVKIVDKIKRGKGGKLRSVISKIS